MLPDNGTTFLGGDSSVRKELCYTDRQKVMWVGTGSVVRRNIAKQRGCSQTNRPVSYRPSTGCR